MMHFLIVSIIFLATTENVLPFIIGLLKTPPGYIFLGTVHHPADYFYYLSQFAQGGYRWLTTVDLFTGEPIAPTFVGWSNVIVGRVFHLVGLSPIVAYQAGIVIFSVCLFVAAYRLMRVILKTDLSALLALYLFTLFHAFPILRDGKPSYGDYWNNFAVPRVRFGGVPHQLLLNTASFALVYFLIQWIQNKQKTGKTLIGLGISSLILASLQPVLWALICAITVVTIAFLYLLQPLTKKWNKIFAGRFPNSPIENLPNSDHRSMPKVSDNLVSSAARKFLLHHDSFPILILLACGLPPVLYLTRLFTILPFSQLTLWEAAQQTPLSLNHFISATGPVFLIALFILPIFVRRISFAKLFTVLFTLASLTLFLSPLPHMIGISQARFMSTLTILLLTVIASSGLTQLLTAKHKLARVLSIAFIIGLSALLIPNHLKTLRLVSQFDPTNAYYYLPAAQYAFLQESGRAGNRNDTFLVTWPYNGIFPAITGKRTYYGHPLLTIKQEEKAARAVSLFTGALTPGEMMAFLAENHITYVIAATDNPGLAAFPFLTRVSASKTLILYQVELR